GKGELVFHLQNYQAGTDTLTKCDFGGFGISPATYADLLEAATGLHLDPQEFDIIGERIWNVTRLFNLREGIDPIQDTLPKRFVNEALKDGPARGHRISKEDMHSMLQEYYRARGWTEGGIPTRATLVRLGLQEVTTSLAGGLE
ncbi:MAG: aldehyde ferredoxin oxidoreductase C-terminal domain-containing protein, partial [Desulfopila sp.]